MGLIVNDGGEAKFKKKAVNGEKLERAEHTATFTPANITFKLRAQPPELHRLSRVARDAELAATGAT